jgi:restriction system protein
MSYVTNTSDKNKKTAFFLCLFGGFLGLHRFYVGRILTGILWLVTLGFLGIGWLIDLLVIALGGFRDNVGAPLRVWVHEEKDAQ